jgi:hypothetical protein
MDMARAGEDHQVKLRHRCLRQHEIACLRLPHPPQPSRLHTPPRTAPPSRRAR